MTSERAKTHSISSDSAGFISLIEPYRRELHLHCYRLLGSLHFAVYHATGPGGTFRAFGIQVITLNDGAPGLLIADVTTFLDPSLLPIFGFPPEMPI